MIRSENVMNRGVGSDTQGCALPKFITDVSLGDRAPFKRASTPACASSLRQEMSAGERRTLSLDASQQSFLSVSTPILTTRRVYGAAAVGLKIRNLEFELK